MGKGLQGHLADHTVTIMDPHMHTIQTKIRQYLSGGTSYKINKKGLHTYE